MNYMPLYSFLSEYTERNTNNEYRPVAVGRYGIRTRESIYSKELAKDYSKNKIIFKDTLTIGMGSVQIDIGILSTDETYSVSPAYHTYRINGINPNYLRYCLECRNQDMFVRYVKKGSRQGKTIDLNRWLTYEIPVYSKEQQEEIVERIDNIQDLIRASEMQLAKLDELVKSQFVEMFGDPVTNTRNLPTDTLANLGELNRGVSKSRPRNLPELLGGPYPLVQTGEVSNCDLYINHYESTYSKLGLAQSKMWPKGTLCITIAANIAQTGILDFDACFPDSVVGFINGDRVTQIYIHYWFSFFQKILDEQAPQVAQKNINLQILRDLSVVVPSLEEQKAFDEFVKQAYKSKLAVKQSLEKLETLKKSIMQKYFG